MELDESPILTSWCNFGWSTPYYWDYGPNEYIYCNDGVVYVNGAWYQPAPVFYAQTVQMIDKAPALPADAAAQVEWLPLGVFAVTPDGVAEADVLAQLAVTKDGLIGGTIFDQKAGKSYAATGTIDKNSQRAVWSYTNDQNVRILMETSVNNLTQNESTGLVHYGPNDQRVIEIVRLQEPAGRPTGSGPTGAVTEKLADRSYSRESKERRLFGLRFLCSTQLSYGNSRMRRSLNSTGEPSDSRQR